MLPLAAAPKPKKPSKFDLMPPEEKAIATAIKALNEKKLIVCVEFINSDKKLRGRVLKIKNVGVYLAQTSGYNVFFDKNDIKQGKVNFVYFDNPVKAYDFLLNK